MRLLVTGGNGTIGSKFSLPRSNFNFDINDDSKLKKWMYSENVNGKSLIHLAAIVGKYQVDKDPHYSYKVNVERTIHLGKLALQGNVGKFFYLSTSHVYESKFEAISESDRLMPQNLYAEQKLQAEEGLRQVFANDKDKLVILRIFSVLELGTSEYSLGGAITSALSSKHPYEIKNAKDIRDFMTPKSVAESIEKCVVENLSGGTYNICTGVGLTVRKAVEKLLRIYNLSPSNITFKDEFSKSPVIIGSNSKIINEIPSLSKVLTWEY